MILEEHMQINSKHLFNQVRGQLPRKIYIHNAVITIILYLAKIFTAMEV